MRGQDNSTADTTNNVALAASLYLGVLRKEFLFLGPKDTTAECSYLTMSYTNGTYIQLQDVTANGSTRRKKRADATDHVVMSSSTAYRHS